MAFIQYQGLEAEIMVSIDQSGIIRFLANFQDAFPVKPFAYLYYDDESETVAIEFHEDDSKYAVSTKYSQIRAKQFFRRFDIKLPAEPTLYFASRNAQGWALIDLTKYHTTNFKGRNRTFFRNEKPTTKTS